MSIEEIFHYLKVNDKLITGGQPTEEQLKAASEENYAVVINLATIDPRSSLGDEAGLVNGLGMSYIHIPVDWENPEEQDFLDFDEVMQKLGDRKALIHCAANFRVTAFYSMHAMKHLGWSESQAKLFRENIWLNSNYPTWDEFIRKETEKILSSRR